MFSVNINQIIDSVIAFDINMVIEAVSSLKFEQIIGYILSPLVQEKLFWVKTVFIAVSCFFLIFILYVVKKTFYINELFLTDAEEFLNYKTQGTKKMAKQWNKYLARLKIDSVSGWKLSIVEADTLLGLVLQRMGVEGENMNEKIENLNSDIIPNIDNLRKARRISENIIQDPGYLIELKEAEKVLEIYGDVLKSLKAF